MGYGTDVRHIKAARKKHVCDWCGQHIEEGESYKRWRWFDYGEANTVRLHDDCFVAHIEDCGIGEYEFMFANNPRGCNCGWSKGCERCEANKAKGGG